MLAIVQYAFYSVRHGPIDPPPPPPSACWSRRFSMEQNPYYIEGGGIDAVCPVSFSVLPNYTNDRGETSHTLLDVTSGPLEHPR